MTVDKFFSLSLALLLFLILISIPLNQVDAEELDSTAAAALITEQGTDVEIPSTYTSIGNNAFSHSQLTSVEIPNSGTEIGNNAFGNQLQSVVLSDGIKSIPAGAFYNTQLTSVVIPNFVP